jgi:hypothetical protein
MLYLRFLSDIASAHLLAATRGSCVASAHRALSVALVQSQGYLYRSCALLLKASEPQVLCSWFIVAGSVIYVSHPCLLGLLIVCAQVCS